MEREDRTIKILHLNGSPHGKYGNTAKLSNMVIEGIRSMQENVEVKEVYLSKEDILPCTGCTRCMRRGDCSLAEKDRVEEIIKLMYWADGIIVGSPVYVVSVTSILKKFFERCARLTHRPDLDQKYAVSVVTSAGLGEDEVATYISQVLGAMGIQVTGELTAVALVMGRFQNINELSAKAKEQGEQLLAAIMDKRVLPLSDFERARRERFGSLISMASVGESLFKADHQFWKDKNWIGKEE